ncbi:MAG: hypothetical protein COW59_07890 [Lysobacterales bacterium CG17_big_fil_post_rev_8_21_14_2_50_64_11]|nr:MAG: hypothetical protein COW59_07890 [Xanthomonadales bacterium CG17_big_fil_post_rev_8_21_14_2_50_64_11]PIX59569.1 MAG: DUF2878 domain-containing protein [Xanthomonadales bacterium CG_4_10_14_3_um_filter_64_11]
MKRVLANAAGFQLVWFATVAGAGNGMAWTGPVAAMLFAGWVLSDARTRAADLWLLLRALPIGYASDSLWVACGWMHFAQPWPSPPFAPIWIIALWLGFILSINHSLVFLRGRPWPAALLGAVFGPAAYYAASNGFAAATFDIDVPAMMLILALAWAALLPLLLALGAHHHNRPRNAPMPITPKEHP